MYDLVNSEREITKESSTRFQAVRSAILVITSRQ